METFVTVVFCVSILGIASWLMSWWCAGSLVESTPCPPDRRKREPIEYPPTRVLHQQDRYWKAR